MKKIILLLVLLVSAIAVNAATYRVKYDVQNQRSTTFTVSVGYDRLTINQTGYSLRRMGTITSSGMVFSLMFRKTSFKTPEILIKTRA